MEPKLCSLTTTDLKTSGTTAALQLAPRQQLPMLPALVTGFCLQTPAAQHECRQVNMVPKSG